jgi:hypothetical protein
MSEGKAMPTGTRKVLTKMIEKRRQLVTAISVLGEGERSRGTNLQFAVMVLHQKWAKVDSHIQEIKARGYIDFPMN